MSKIKNRKQSGKIQKPIPLTQLGCGEFIGIGFIENKS